MQTSVSLKYLVLRVSIEKELVKCQCYNLQTQLQAK